jgi:putative transposase
MKDPLAIVWSRALPHDALPSSVTVTKDGAGRYFVSILVEEEIAHFTPTKQTIGADLGLKSFVVLSDGETIGNPKFFSKDEKKLAKAQRRHARKKKGSKNRDKARLKVARIHARIADQRSDFLQKLSTRLIRENQTICVESLAVKNMVKNPKLSKAISDVGWSAFVSQLEYKANWYGRTLVKIDKWYPSSKRCFDCGHILSSLSLDVRSWSCPECGVHHDRDVNAAKNIHAVGLTVSDACGEAIRPGAVKAKPGTPQRSRNP